MITKDSKQNVSDAMCWVFWDALLFCNITTDSKQNVSDAMCWVVWDAMFFRNQFYAPQTKMLDG
jgi:hypothetical protein